ncbi:pyridoxal phosphate-dependent transferase [Bisporella sp. PMI_857]|nr:pyridoxal phosphate-dependent transferase [Bisporella sp. PMI_857]
MSPSAITEVVVQDPWTVPASSCSASVLITREAQPGQKLDKNDRRRSVFLLDRHLHKEYPVVVGGNGNYLYTSDGRVVFDASCGAAVSCLGHGNERVIEAVCRQMKTGTPYLASAFWRNKVVDDLCKELIDGTENMMSRAYLTGSGSEAMEAAIKLARQFFYEGDRNTRRVNFITREGSYHGSTIGALGISGHVARKAPYLPFLMDKAHQIPACNAYRQRKEGESDASFVARKADELEKKFQELGPNTVIGFIAEPIVGAALGCVTAVPGYLQAMQDVCHKHGALFILDEIMCGMGRTGTLHAWQQEGVIPDIQAVGKGLSGGYQPIAAVLISHKVVQALMNGTGAFMHGHTYQGMPVQAAAALEVQKILREDGLLKNVKKQGAYLERRLKAALGDHPNVGDIRGRGLFWGLEFVKDKATKEPFEPKLQVAQMIHELGISSPYNMTIYPGTGTVDGDKGDHVLIAPAFIVTEADIDRVVKTLTEVVTQVFQSHCSL